MEFMTLADRLYFTDDLLRNQRYELESKARYSKEAKCTELCQGDRKCFRGLSIFWGFTGKLLPMETRLRCPGRVSFIFRLQSTDAQDWH